MINLYRIDHIAQGVAELEPQLHLLEGLFGCRRLHTWQDTEQGVAGALLEIPGTPATRWMILAPLNESAELNTFLKSPRGPGFMHVAAEVTELPAVSSTLQACGVKDLLESAYGIDVLMGPADGPEGLPFRYFDKNTPNMKPGGQAVSLKATPEGPDLGLRGLLHVCQAHSDRDALARFYEQSLGMREIYRTPDGAWPDMGTLMLSVPGSSIIWEVIEPQGEDSHVQRFLDRKGAACHHLTFEIADAEQAQRACDHYDVPTFGLNEGTTDGGRWCDFFVHPKFTGGILIQLFWEERPGIWARSDKIASQH